MDAIVPEGFTTIRQAVFVLAVAIFAGIENSDAIKEFRAAGLDSQFDHAEVTASVKILWSEVDAGRIVISVYHPRTGERHRIDPGLLKDIPFLRSARFVGLDYLRPSHPLGRRLLEIFRSSRAATWSSLLRSVQLLVSTVELDKASKRQRGSRKRKQNRPASEKRPGRPSKQAMVESAIIDVVDEGKWTGVESAKKLTSLVNRLPIDLEVSESTVRRNLQGLYIRTGDRRYQRLEKSKKSASP